MIYSSCFLLKRFCFIWDIDKGKLVFYLFRNAILLRDLLHLLFQSFKSTVMWFLNQCGWVQKNFFLCYRHVTQLQICLLFFQLRCALVANSEISSLKSEPPKHCEKDSCSVESRDPAPGYLATVAMSRTVTKVVPSKEQDEGMGAKVRRSIGGSQVYCIYL